MPLDTTNAPQGGRWLRGVIIACVAIGVLVFALASVFFDPRTDAVTTERLALCRQWEKAASDLTDAGNTSNARLAIDHAIEMCGDEEAPTLVALRQRVSEREHAATAPNGWATVTPAGATSAAAASGATAPAERACDADALWFGDSLPDGDRAVAFVKALSAWTPECRRRAMESACSRGGCDDVVTDKVIAAAGATERASLRGIRVAHNRAAVAVGRELYGKVSSLAGHASAIRSTPRGSAYRQRNAGLDERAEELAEGNPCVVRMSADFARIRQVQAEIDERLPDAPAGTVALETALSNVQGCVDCSDDREPCDEIAESLRGVRELLQSYDVLVAADERAGTK